MAHILCFKSRPWLELEKHDDDLQAQVLRGLAWLHRPASIEAFLVPSPHQRT